MITIKCKRCLENFSTKDKRQQFCSTRCYYESRMVPARYCSIKNCNNWVDAKEMCSSHYAKYKRWGDPNISKRRPKGFGTVTTNGYRLITVNGKRFSEHRYMISLIIGRPLKRSENVHHLNGNKLDNRVENLKLMTHGEHTTLHLKKRWSR